MDKRLIGFELITVGHLIKRERDRANDEIKKRVLGEEVDVSCANLSIIKYLADHKDEEIYQKNIENFLALTAPSVSNKLRDLQKNGLVERVYSKVDTRLKQVILTDKAMEIDEKLRDDMENFESRLGNLLSKEEKDLLIKIVDKIKNEFE